VIGSATTNGSGNATVTFTGSALFTSATSYRCSLTPEGSGAITQVAVVNGPLTNGFTIKGANSTTYDFICVGN
jgi:hypothetical protein